MLSADTLPATTTGLFDSHGRRLPTDLAAPTHATVRRRFICSQPVIDYAAIHARISANLGGGDVLSAAAFQQRAEAILERVGQDARTAGIVNAVHVPFFLPQVPDILAHDLGEDVETVYLPAVARSFEARFPGQCFTNHYKHGLAGKLRIQPGSRHEHLLHAVQDGVVVGVLFISLTEYSIPAALEQMAALPDNFLLTGGADLSAALVGSPELLLRTDGYPPLLWLAALGAESALAGYHFEAYGYDLTFNRRVHFDQAAESGAATLTVLG